MKKYLGIDFGDKNIGLAIAEQDSIAVPLKVVQMNSGFWQVLEEVIDNQFIDTIVVGWPQSLSGQENARTKMTQRFIEQIRKRHKVSIVKEDERLTTSAAKSKGLQGRVDAAAAAEILQTYLDRHAKLNVSA
jgi:putative holliday junction resolvase